MVLCIQQRSLALFGGLKSKVSIWPDAKTLEQKLYDKGFILANIFEDVDGVLPPTPTCENMSKSQSLLSQCEALNHELACWYEELVEAAKSLHNWCTFLPQLYSDSVKPIAFPDLRLAHLLVCFWVLRMVLTLMKASIYQIYMEAQEKDSLSTSREGSSRSSRNTSVAESIAAAQGAPHNSLVKDILPTSMRYANLILRSMPYCTCDQVGIASCTRCLFSLRGVLGYLRITHQHNEKMKVCHDLITRILEERKVCFATDIARHSGRWGDTNEGLR
jgi:hypothetical protein